MSFDEVHDVPVFHAFRYNRKAQGLQYDTKKWKDVVVLKPLPPNNFFCEELRFSRQKLFECLHDKIIYLVYLLVICSRHPQGFYRHRAPIDRCLVNV